MDALIARPKALGISPSSKKRKLANGPSKSTTPPKPHKSDPILSSIARATRVPNSLAYPAEKDPTLPATGKKSFGHIRDPKLRAHLAHLAEHSAQVKEMREDAEMLGTTQAGAMEVEGKMERTWKITQSEVKESVGVEAGKTRREWVLDGGAYAGRYSRNGRYVTM
jgi:U3 small nucleolar RNA-associated protein 7